VLLLSAAAVVSQVAVAFGAMFSFLIAGPGKNDRH